LEDSDDPHIGRQACDTFGTDDRLVLAAVVRGETVLAPRHAETLAVGDTLIFVVDAQGSENLSGSSTGARASTGT
jgi:K+/H+ antiporter YhaU regulatory subunit KhtT